MKKNLYFIFEEPTKYKHGQLIQVFIFLNIFISILIMFLETEESLNMYTNTFATIYNINVILFSIEYILRLYSYGYKHKHNKKFTRLKYAFTPMMLIDLIAILPFYLTMIGLNTEFLRY